MTEIILQVDHISVTYQATRGTVKAVRDVSFTLCQGETLALIGESGCGKTTLGLALTRLLPKTARITHGTVRYTRHGQTSSVLDLPAKQMRAFRWQECAMVFQSALNALNPVLRIRDHILDTARAHGQHDQRAALHRAAELFELVRLDPQRVIASYPHELSGGMRQRVLLALGVLLDPQVVILDEPTTALDILTQRTVIESLRALQKSRGFACIFISHDLAIAAELADRVATMYAGKIIEIGAVNDIFYRQHHPYTLGLIHAVPTVSGEMRDLVSIPGSPPDLISLPTGCKFHPRCPYASPRCHDEEPALQPVTTPRQPVEVRSTGGRLVTVVDAEADSAVWHGAACFHQDRVVSERDAF